MPAGVGLLVLMACTLGIGFHADDLGVAGPQCRRSSCLTDPRLLLHFVA